MAALGSRAHTVALSFAASAVFVVTWLLRYNDPEGTYGGLTDDHFFYVTQGWQILFGELPARDFADPGAPLTFALTAALQVLLGRGVWSEYVFCVTALSAGAALTFVIAARATGSIALGIAGALLELALLPRLYNYPKIVIYAAGIAALWWWASRPSARRTWLVALVTVVAFLIRHDHGAYLAAGFGVLLLALADRPWLERLRHGVVFGLATLLLLMPYLLYLQVQGGVARHFVTAYQWSAREFEREPAFVPPTLVWHPATSADSDAPASEWWNHEPFVALSRYSTWWLYWVITLLPLVASLLLIAAPAAGPRGWSRARLKVLVVIVLAAIVNNRFLRGNLDARFADVAVPLAILATWSLYAAGHIVTTGRLVLVQRSMRLPIPARALVALAAASVCAITALVMVRPVRELIGNAGFTEGIRGIRAGIERVTARTRQTWPLDAWGERDEGLIGLAMYLQACTKPDDRILAVPLWSPLAGLAQRGFAGGRLDLSQFAGSIEEEELTVARLRRQSVPVVFGPRSAELDGFARSLPIIADYLQREYDNLGDRDLGTGGFSLLVHRSARRVGLYEPLAFPCFVEPHPPSST